MGNLTDDMTRLRGEVDALRSDRGALMQELARGARDLASTVSAMQANFASAHAAMARKTGEERGAFVADIIREVSSLLGDFSRMRGDMARTGRNDRKAFLLEMRRQVRGMRKETADDLAGVRLAWHGHGLKRRREVQLKKEPVVVKPVLPPAKEEAKKPMAAPEIKAEKPPVTFREPQKKEEAKKPAAVPEAPAVKTPKVKAPTYVRVSKPPFQKSKEKSRLDEKPTKTMTRAKRGRK